LQAELEENGVIRYYTDINGSFPCSFLRSRLQRVARFSYQRAFSESYRFEGSPVDAYRKGVSVDVCRVSERKLLPRRIGYLRYRFAAADLAEQGTFCKGTGETPFTNRFLTNADLGIFPLDTLESLPSADLQNLIYRKCDAAARELTAGSYAVYEFSCSETGFIRLEGDVSDDCHFLVLFDEVDFREDRDETKPKNICFYRNDTYNIVEYRAKAGTFRHLTFEPYTARYLKIVVLSGELLVSQIGILCYENAECDHHADYGRADLNAIAQAAARTFRHNAVDLPTDCSSRERGRLAVRQLVYIESGTAFYGK